MIGNQAFQSWVVILVGAVMFAGLFVVLAMMMELLFDGTFRVTPGAVRFGLAAFVGYVGTAVFLRRNNTPPRSWHRDDGG